MSFIFFLANLDKKKLPTNVYRLFIGWISKKSFLSSTKISNFIFPRMEKMSFTYLLQRGYYYSWHTTYTVDAVDLAEF